MSDWLCLKCGTQNKDQKEAIMMAPYGKQSVKMQKKVMDKEM